MKKAVKTKQDYRPVAVTPREEQEVLWAPGRTYFDDFNLRELVRKVMRHKWLIIGTVFISTVIAVAAVTQIPKEYTAEALIRIEPKNSNILDVQGVLSGLGSDDQAMESEIEVFTSRELAKKVVDKLHLEQYPEFNKTLRPKGFIQTYLDPHSWFLSKKATNTQGTARVVDELLEKLSASVKGRSRVISVQAESQSPELAATIVNTLANIYITNQVSLNIEASKRASAGLNEQIADLRRQVDESEKAVEKYRAQAGLISTNDGTTLQERQLADLNSQLALAHADVETKAAKLSQVQDLFKSGNIDSLPEVLQSPLIQSLREQESQVQRNIAELSSEYGNSHPKMINARAEAADLDHKIKIEIAKIVSGMQTDVNVAKAKERALQNTVDGLESKVAQSNTSAIKLHALEREASANKTLLENFMSRVKETSAQEDTDIQLPPGRIISMADIPEDPSFPKTKQILALVAVGSALLGLVIVFVIEQFNDGYRSGDEMEAEYGIPVLGLVPLLKSTTPGFFQTMRAKMFRSAKVSDNAPTEDDDPTEYILDKPASAFGEAVRGVRTSLLLKHGNKLPLRILITSAQPNEGKTVLTVCLTRTLAMSGFKVILIEADLRLPAVHRDADRTNERGLTEYLSGEAELDELIQVDSESGAHVVTAGRSTNRPLDLVSSEQMKDLLDDLAMEYDFVIIDSPPIMAVSDARVLSTFADLTVFAVRWASTSRKVVNLAISQLQAAGAVMAGTVLTMVDAKAHSQYDYGDSGYYHTAIQKYYVE
jgi:succinoglycan biosynthesis transport protein ExoP